MAKKSNKTAHVLNLISNSKHIAVESENTSQQANDVPEDIHPTIKNSLEKAAKSEALSNKIKENLEKEFSKELSEEHKSGDMTKNNENPDSMLNSETENTKQNGDLPDAEIKSDETLNEAVNINESDKTADTVSDEKTDNNASDLENTYKNTDTETEENSQNASSESVNSNENKSNALNANSENSASDENNQKNEDTEFMYLNVCEELVRDKVHEYMDRFNKCKCKRCVADTMALALTNLPPKYVVLNNKDEIPFISFYENKYRILLMTELTKACLTVNSNPRHKRH